MPPLTTPPGFTAEYIEWALSQPRLFDDSDPGPPTEPDEPESDKTKSDRAVCDRTECDRTESNRAESDRAVCDRTECDRTESNRVGSNRTECDRTESNRTESGKTKSDEPEYDGPFRTRLGPPGAPCDFTWNSFKRPLAEWQAGLEAIFEPYSDEAWSVCTTDEWLYGVLHERLVTRFERCGTAPTEQEEKEIHVICMLAKYYLIKREEMGQAHLSIYAEEALSDAIIKLTMCEIDFTE